MTELLKQAYGMGASHRYSALFRVLCLKMLGKTAHKEFKTIFWR